jgi:hypothetical protein
VVRGDLATAPSRPFLSACCSWPRWRAADRQRSGAASRISSRRRGGLGNVRAMDVVARWRSFERVLTERGLGWGLRYLPAQLRYARKATHPATTRGRVLPHVRMPESAWPGALSPWR